MNRFLAALLVAGIGAVPLLASADEMKAAATSSPMMVCHAAKAGETSNAMTTSKTALVCANVDMKKMMAGPDMANVKTSKEADTAWKEFLAHQFDVR